MLRRAGEGRQLDFADFTVAARSVPRTDPLLQMRALQSDAELDRMFADAYDPSTGRPCHPPSRVFRICLLQFLHNLSDEAVVKQVGFNLLYREFVGLGWNDAVPDSTVLCRFRARIGPERLRRAFDGLLAKAREEDILADERRIADGTHIEAKIAKRSRRELCAAGRRYVLNALKRLDRELARALAKRYPPVAPKSLGSPEARLEEERARTAGFLAELEGGPFGEEVARRGALLRRVALEGNPDKLESFDDQDARFGHKTKDWTFTGYKAHESIDAKSRLITAVQVIPGHESEPAHIGELLDREPGGLPKDAAVIGDKAYTSQRCHAEIRARGGEPVSPRMQVNRQVEGFQYDSANDRLVCPAGKASIARTRQGNGTLHQFSTKDCATCPLREKCLRPSELRGTAKPRARIWLGDTLRPKMAAGKAGAEHRKQCYGERYKIEPVFAEQKGPRSRLGVARYWGIVKVEIQTIFTAIATNALRLVRAIAKRASLEAPKRLLAPV
jgi:IS5 family transposase